MRLTASRAYTRTTAVPKMPPGLVELMEGLTKDILKSNPTNIYEFCANHFEKLLEIRDRPSSKTLLTLEEKISIAQEKIRQRAKERQEKFDYKVESDVRSTKHDDTENDNFSEEEKNTTTEKQMPHLKAPVHHDLDLSPSSEVEISHEPFTDNSLTSKDSNVDESDEIPISKSSTYSSVSKSTVIDLVNDHEINKEEIDNGNDAPKTEIDYTNEPLQEKETVDEPKDDISQNEIIEPATNATEIQDIQALIIDNNNQQAVKDDFIVIISDEGNAASVHDNKTEDTTDNSIKIFDESSTPIKSEGEPTLNIPVEVNVIIEDNKNVTNQLEPNQDENSSTKLSIEDVKIDAKGPTIKITDDDIHTSGDPNELLYTVIENGEKIDQIKVSETETENSTRASEDTVLQDVDNIVTDITTCVDNHSKMSDSNEFSEHAVEEKNDQAQISAQEFLVTKADDAEIIQTPDPMEKNHIGNATDGVNLDTTASENEELVENNITESQTNNELNLKIDEDYVYNFEDGIKISTEVEKNISKDDIENIKSTSLSKAEEGSFENNDDSSVIGSDLSKAEDDVPLNDQENEQNNMDLETAAVTIQKVFRSFLFKSRNSTFEDITNDEATSLEEDNDKKEEYYAAANLNKERRPLGISRMDTVLQTVNEEKSLSLSTDDSSTLSSAATTIQAHVRGFLVRNRLNSYKTVSTNSLVNSNEMLDTDTEQQKNKTVLNIHIVPEEGNYLSRDESLITSMDLSLDGSPPSSINLHPLSYDLVSERRKLLKREDAIQSVSPPSNNSGKLSEDSVKEVLLSENGVSKTESNLNEKEDQLREDNSPETMVTTVTAVAVRNTSNEQDDTETPDERHERSMSSDESDVITPYIVASPRSLVGDFENSSRLLHSGEFHDVVLPTKVSRSDTTVVRGE